MPNRYPVAINCLHPAGRYDFLRSPHSSLSGVCAEGRGLASGLRVERSGQTHSAEAADTEDAATQRLSDAPLGPLGGDASTLRRVAC